MKAARAKKKAEAEAQKLQLETEAEAERIENERRLKLEKRQKAKNALATELQEQETRNTLLNEICGMMTAMTQTKFELDVTNRYLEHWTRYVNCRGLPFPEYIPTMYTYIFLKEHEEELFTDLDKAFQRAEDFIYLLDVIDDLIEMPLNASESTYSNYFMVRDDYRNELVYRIDLACHNAIRNITQPPMKMLDYKTVEFRRSSVNGPLAMGMWSNLDFPKGEKEFFPQPYLEFPEISMSVLLPKPFDREVVVYRGMHQKYDHYSDTSRSWYPVVLPEYYTQELFQLAVHRGVERDCLRKAQEEIIQQSIAKRTVKVPNYALRRGSSYVSVEEPTEETEPEKENWVIELENRISRLVPVLEAYDKRHLLGRSDMEVILLHELNDEETLQEGPIRNRSLASKVKFDRRQTVYLTALPPTKGFIPNEFQEPWEEVLVEEEDGTIHMVKRLPEHIDDNLSSEEEETEELKKAMNKSEVMFLDSYEIEGGGTAVKTVYVNDKNYDPIWESVFTEDMTVNTETLERIRHTLKPIERLLSEYKMTEMEFRETTRRPTLVHQRVVKHDSGLDALLDKSPSEIVNDAEELKNTELRKLLTINVEPDELNLRKFRVVGGTFHVELLVLPKQEHFLQKCSVRIQYGPYNVKKRDFRVDYEPPKITDEDEAKRDDNLEDLIIVELNMPKDVMWFEQPQPVVWVDKMWTTKYTHDVKTVEDKLVFRLGCTGVIGLAVYKYFNLPFQTWELKPLLDEHKTVVFGITTNNVVVEFLIRGRQVCLSSIQNATNESLEPILMEFMEPQRIVRKMRKSGVDIFPDYDTYIYVEGSGAKNQTLENHTYHCMAILSCCYKFQWSRWNLAAGWNSLVLQMREVIHEVQMPYNTLYVQLESASFVTCTEVSPSFSTVSVSGMNFYPDLHSLASEMSSEEAISMIELADLQTIETVYYMLRSTKVLSYS